ncbi:MAG: hypothetical protein M1818_003859 [Claussenomyces sp. TS43310]|nr:MAG: hypothetical protein M1818_003859 [Claussenomyces sp. TS43310]
MAQVSLRSGKASSPTGSLYPRLPAPRASETFEAEAFKEIENQGGLFYVFVVGNFLFKACFGGVMLLERKGGSMDIPLDLDMAAVDFSAQNLAVQVGAPCLA